MGHKLAKTALFTNPNISLLGRVFLPVNIGSQKEELKEREHV
jgi:hypothetical protein